MPGVEYVLCDPPREWVEAEGLIGKNKLWKMERTLYSGRPAAKAWTQWIADDLAARCGMERCEAIPTFQEAGFEGGLGGPHG